MIGLFASFPLINERDLVTMKERKKELDRGIKKRRQKNVGR